MSTPTSAPTSAPASAPASIATAAPGPAAMTIYRAYCFDAARHVVSVEEIAAAGDEEAIDLAYLKGFGDKCEIWDGKRLVAQLDGERLTG